MHADFDLLQNGTAVPTRGGAREGAGRKPAGYVKSDDAKKLDESRARKEAAQADMAELNFKKESGEYLSRSAFREASATLLAELAQTLRSLPDQLERRHALAAPVVVAIEKDIDAALTSLSAGLELFVGPDE